MKKIILNVLLFIIGFLSINAQIIVGDDVNYNGAPGEPILQSPLNMTYSQLISIGEARGYRCKCVTVSDLGRISDKYPNLRNYKIITYITERYNSKGTGVFLEGNYAKWRPATSFHPGYWEEGLIKDLQHII